MLSEDRPISPRWVLGHVLRLPIGCSFNAELRGGQQFLGWDEGRYMQAALINAVRAHQYITTLANIDPKKTKPKPPDPWPIPDKQVKAKRQDAPGSFGFIARSKIAAIKKKREGGG